MATLREQLAEAITNGKHAVDAGDLDKAREYKSQAERLQESIELAKSFDGFAPSPAPVRPPMPGAGEGTMPNADDSTDEAKHAEAVNKAVNMLRFGEPEGPQDVVMREIYGGDYRQRVADETKAFVRYLRYGERERGRGRQTWDIDHVKGMLMQGMTVAEIKSTMVEGQDTLGGYAVPPQYGNQIIQRLPGLTAVRGGGAMVVQTASNAIEWLKVTGGGSQYASGMRGYWGSEVQDPTETNFTVGLEQISVNTYTYKVPMSVSLLEDATNIDTIFMQLVQSTLAIDEDAAFLTGDGASEPLGIIPDSTNSRSLDTVNTGDASALTFAGLRSLRRKIQSQYRSGAVWIMESDSAGDIENLVDGISRPYFDYLDGAETFMRARLLESEAMPAVAGSAYPIIFADLSGYVIVERLGLAVQRYNDSNTGINKVEFQVRRRIGGDLVEPWKFALQYVSA